MVGIHIYQRMGWEKGTSWNWRRQEGFSKKEEKPNESYGQDPTPPLTWKARTKGWEDWLGADVRFCGFCLCCCDRLSNYDNGLLDPWRSHTQPEILPQKPSQPNSTESFTFILGKMFLVGSTTELTFSFQIICLQFHLWDCCATKTCTGGCLFSSCQVSSTNKDFYISNVGGGDPIFVSSL